MQLQATINRSNTTAAITTTTVNGTFLAQKKEEVSAVLPLTDC
jgi:hypothetical protein